MLTAKRHALFVAAMLLVGCGETLNNSAGPTIESLTLEPNVISLSETGMTDEFITATLVVSGFTDELNLDDTVVFLQDPTRVDAEPGTQTEDGGTIVLGMIAKTWLVGLDAGTYPVGAEVHSATEEVLQQDLAVITVEE